MLSPTAVRSDADILAEARRALAATSAAAIPEMPVRARVVDGTITVTGNAATSASAADLCARLRQIPDVSEVVDRIVDDDSLQQLVRAVIAADERVSGGIHKVHVVLGTVYVDWEVRDMRCQRDLREALLLVPGVRAVVHGHWSRLQDADRALLKASSATSSERSTG